jgi:hypothetical protein
VEELSDGDLRNYLADLGVVCRPESWWQLSAKGYLGGVRQLVMCKLFIAQSFSRRN